VADGPIACVGCGGLVPDVEGPTHRYIGASPGCWAIYTELMATGLGASGRLGSLAVEAYAVQHPGVRGPQSTPSVWVHLLALCLTLERGWRPDQAIRIRKVAADAFEEWKWLESPRSVGDITVVDVAAAAPVERPEVIDGWVQGAWRAWSPHHEAVRARADSLFG
jgi:hypothetical protein